MNAEVRFARYRLSHITDWIEQLDALASDDQRDLEALAACDWAASDALSCDWLVSAAAQRQRTPLISGQATTGARP